MAQLLNAGNCSYGVAYLAWSPDSTRLAVCGPDDCPEVDFTNNNMLMILCAVCQNENCVMCNLQCDDCPAMGLTRIKRICSSNNLLSQVWLWDVATGRLETKVINQSQLCCHCS